MKRCLITALLLIAIAPALAAPNVTAQREITGLMQALEQFVLYTGVRPDPALVAEATAFSRLPG